MDFVPTSDPKAHWKLEPPPTKFEVLLPAPCHALISTPRLRLRPATLSDAEGLFSIRSRAETTRWLENDPDENIETTRQWMSKKAFSEPPSAVGLSFFFVISRADDPSGRIIGSVAINRLVPYPTIGYSIHPDEWGKGYGAEAVSAVVDAWWALPRRPMAEFPNGSDGVENAPVVEKLYAECVTDNMGSVRILQKCGFQIVHRQDIERYPCAWLEMEMPEKRV